MMKIANNITELIGNTPLLKLNRYAKIHELDVSICAKLESFNPLSSVKDRVALALIQDGEKTGKIQEDTIIIEPTSGNTGIGLAFVTASKGYSLILTMPETMSIERRNLLSALGAKVVLTEGAKGMQGAVDMAEELHKQYTNSVILGQFTNSANPQVHFLTTGPEIWEATAGEVDVFIAGIGTGGSITGIGSYLKSKNKEIQIIGVEPDTSPLLTTGKAGPHKIQGIGANFIPEILDVELVDEVVTIGIEEAKVVVKEIARTEGILVGISSGAVIAAATKVGKRREYKEKNIVVLLPDTGERYMSTGVFE